MSVIDLSKSRELRHLIESLTHSGLKDLNIEELNNIIEYCRENVYYLTQAHTQIMCDLKANHSEVRYSAAQLCHKLFMEFEEFRNLTLKCLNEYLSLTLGIDSKEDLPPPKPAARALKRITLENLLIWKKSFPIQMIDRACRYLEEAENVDFNVLDIVDPKERKAKEEAEARTLKLNKERLRKINEEMEDLLPDIRCTLTSLESCFALLMPPPEDSEDVKESEKEEDMRLYGIVSSKHAVQIELGNKIIVEEDDENSAIIDAAKDAFTLVNNRFLPKTKAWVELISKAEGEAALMKKALATKEQLELAISKYNRLEIKKNVKKQSNDNDDDEVSSDSDLEEVPDIKPSSKQKMLEEIDFLSPTLGLHKKKEKQKDSKSQTDKVEKNEPEPTPGPSKSEINERKKKLLEVAPKLPFDIDLYHWEDEKLSTPTMIAVNSEGSRFWGGATSEDLSEIPVPDGAASLRTRVIEFVGNWEPVNHQCKAPLPSGKLCPRRDRVKCPFHGLIVERDERGQIINEEDVEKVAKSKNKPDVPDWQDPKLLAEIKAQTGIDLKMPEKGKRKKKKKYPGLTDINEAKNTPSSRIAKKIFDKKSIKRVAETLDKIDHKKHRDKFGDQFNYVHGT